MEAWKWLTQPQHLPILTAIIALVAAIIGGVAGQVVAGLFKVHGDRRSLNSASENAKAAERRWKHERDFEETRLQGQLVTQRASISFSYKLQAYAKFIQAVHEVTLKYWDYACEGTAETEKAANEAHYRAQLARDEMYLFSREIAAKAEELTTHLMKQLEFVNRATFPILIQEPSNSRVEELQNMMRDSLNEGLLTSEGLVKDVPPLHNQPQQDEATTNGNESTTT